MVFAAGLLVAGVALTGCSSGTASTADEAESVDSSEESSSAEADETEGAIHQAWVVLGGDYTYDELKDATDIALMAGGESLTESARRSVWDSILSVKDGLVEKGYPGPDSMVVMQCIPDSISSRGVAITEAVAYCSLETAGIPESLW
ncbi:hypothetical protein [Microterricola viridarii]|nr:hypothetical protein [Microterricola viridarii]